MLFAWITEFGVALGDATRVLQDLSDRAKRLQRSFKFEHNLVATMGTSDIVEIARFDHYFHFAEVAGSGAEAFRRSTGVQCPEIQDLPELRSPSVRLLDDVLKRDVEKPFLAIMYLKTSPVPKLCVSTTQRPAPLVDTLLKEICAGRALWSDYRVALKTSLEPHGETRPQTDIQVAPLIGLDSVELVLVIRAARLEQISAFAWAARNQRLGNYLEASRYVAAVERARNLLGDTTLDLSAAWNESPLFTGTTTIWGMLLYKAEGADERNPSSSSAGSSARLGWEVDGSPDDDRVAAAAASFLVHSTVLSGRFEESVQLPARTQKRFLRACEERGAPARGDSRELDLQELAKKNFVFLMLFDRADNLFVLKSDDATGVEPRLLRAWTVCEIRSYIGLLLASSSESQEDGGKRSARNRSSSELAILTCVPRDLVTMPEDDLLEVFRQRIQKLRDVHLDRRNERGWKFRWLRACRKAGIVYSATNGIVNVISSVLERLDDDLEGFADLLPVLERLVRIVEGTSVKPKQVVRLAGIVDQLAAARGRRDQPLRLPTSTLAFEGHAGYLRSRDAFIAFAESLARLIDPEALLLVRDSAGGGVSCEITPFLCDVVDVSALALHDPIHWLVGHELAHGWLAHTIPDGLPNPASRDALVALLEQLNDWIQADGRKGDEIDAYEERDLDSLLDEVCHLLPTLESDDSLELLAEAARRCVLEVLADLVLWDSLAIPGELRDATDERFWFVHGPGLVFLTRYEFGLGIPSPQTICGFILRSLWLTHVLEPSGESREDGAASEESPHWLEDLEELVAFELRRALPGSQEATAAGLRSPKVRATQERLRCLKEDLMNRKDFRAVDAMNAAWLLAFDQLRRTVHDAHRQGKRLLPILDLWLEFAKTLAQALRQRWALDPAEASDSPEQTVRALYAQYISALKEWSDPTRPWPVMFEGHAYHGGSLGISKRGGILGPHQREYRRATSRLIRQLEEHAHRLRFEKLARYFASEGKGG